MSLKTFVYIQTSFYALLQYSSTRVTMASGGNGNFPEYQVKCYDYKLQAASDTAESSLNSAHSEQFSDARTL